VIRIPLRPLLLGFVVLLLDCASLDPLQSSTCGNGVVDADKNEDCDTFPNDPKDTTRARCGAPTDGDQACHLQCGLQSSGETLQCPDGWGCSVKGICRQPTGNFAKALGAVSGGVVQLGVGDFDGDGRRDLVGSGPLKDVASRLRVHYFDDAGALLQVTALPAQGVAPVVFDHDHNGRDDIAFGIFTGPFSPGALGVVSGLADRTFLPVVFPAVTVPTEAEPVFVFQQGDVKLPVGSENDYEVLLLATDNGGLSLKTIEAEFGAGASRFKVALPVGSPAIRGTVVSAPIFDGSPTSACGEVVVAAATSASAGALYIVSPCAKNPGGKTSSWDPQAEVKSFAVPELGTRGALVADVDGDGHLDVLVDTKNGPFIAYGDPTGTSLLAPTKWKPKGLGGAAKMPIALGDLTGDKRTDLVFESSIAVRIVEALDGGADAGAPADRDGIYMDPGSRPGESWTDALIGNFNADVFPDLVLARVGAPDIQLLAGGATGSTLTTVTTDGIVLAVAKGDFDGDHIDDVAIAEGTPSPNTSDLWIAYGRALGGLEPPRRIGSVDTPRGLLAVPHGSSPWDLGSYAFSAQKGANGLHSTSFTLLVGSGDRQPLAPLLFVDPLSCVRTVDPCMVARTTDPGRNWFPVGLAAGAFTVRDESAVLAYAIGISLSSLGATPVLGAWTADAKPGAPGGLLAPKENQVLDGRFDAYDVATRTTKIATATADIDNLPDQGLSAIVVATNAQDSKDALLLVVRPTKTGTPPPQAKALPGLKVAPGAQLALADIDGDGYRDLIGFFGAPPNGQIVAFLNDHKGDFVVPGINVTTPGEGNAVAFASFAVRGGPVSGEKVQTNALAVLTDQSLVVASLRPDKQGFDVRSLASLLGPKLIGGTGIAAGDFNGDGVDDIAIANGSIRLLLGLPVGSAK
jgi:FG-GAP-like repeat